MIATRRGARISLRRSAASRRDPRWLLVPALVYLLVVTQVPFLQTIWYSLRSWNLLKPRAGQQFVGIDNYTELLTDRNIIDSMVRTVTLTASVVALALLLGLGLAGLLHRRFRGRALARTLLLTPLLIMPAASALVWKNMLMHPVYGFIPWLFKQLGMGSFDPLSQSPFAAVVLIATWQWYPFMMLILLAGLAALDEETLEAARIDGAGIVATTRYVVLPHLSSYMTIAIILGTVFILPTFDILYVATGGGPGFATTNLAYAVYRLAFANFDIGLSSALGIINAVFVIIVATLLVRLTRRFSARGEVFA
jgi:sorbitol/mannitol transport system permease protein